MAVVKDIHQSLIERCKRGDRKSQYELYRLYSKAMFNVSMRIANNYVEAEDILQEAFVRAFKKLDTFKGDSTFGAWLKRIVINTAINHLRKRRMEMVPLEDDRMDVPIEPERETHCSHNMEEIRQAVQGLPEGYRLVFTLYLIEGYDHSEISNILNISEATSKSQFSRAKKKLRSILTQKGHERQAGRLFG